MTLKLLSLKTSFKHIFSALTFLFVVATPSFAQGVEITNYGHSALLIKGEGKSILLNPFKAVGCAKGLSEPKINVDIILASSQLADEGARVANGVYFVQPGSYVVNGLNLEGFKVPHDRLGGRRFGHATLWSWEQGGLKFAHLGGAAAPLSLEDKLLIGRPDVLIIAVGGGSKVYNGREASIVAKELKPKIILPVQYAQAKSSNTCDQQGVEPFLEAMNDVEVQRVGKSFRLSRKIPKNMTIKLMD